MHSFNFWTSHRSQWVNSFWHGLNHWPLGDVQKFKENLFCNANFCKCLCWFPYKIGMGWGLGTQVNIFYFETTIPLLQKIYISGIVQDCSISIANAQEILQLGIMSIHNAQLQYLLCISNGDTAVLHYAIDIYQLRRVILTAVTNLNELKLNKIIGSTLKCIQSHLLVVLHLQNMLKFRIGSINGLVPSATKPLAETMLTLIYVVMWHLRATMSQYCTLGVSIVFVWFFNWF